MQNELRPSIAVTGIGRAEGAPDVAFLSAGVSVRRPTVKEAADTAAEHATGMLGRLETLGIGREAIQTTHYSIGPHHDNRGSVTGYRVENHVVVRLDDIDQVGSVVDALGAGGGEIVINGLKFGFADESALRATAREAAWNDAVDKATHLAGLAGVALGDVIAIDESTGSMRPPEPGLRRMAMAAAGTPVEPGESSVWTAVDVRFAIG